MTVLPVHVGDVSPGIPQMEYKSVPKNEGAAKHEIIQSHLFTTPSVRISARR